MGAFMNWEKPAYREINMSAEIGGYQDDFDERIPKPDDAVPMGETAQSVAKEA